MRVAIVTGSFLPRVNGVTNSVCRALDELRARGHESCVVAPGPAPASYAGFPVRTVPTVSLPGYPGFSVGLATRRRLGALFREAAPDVVHLASPTLTPPSSSSQRTASPASPRGGVGWTSSASTPGTATPG